MMIDLGRLKAEEYFVKHIPFLIYKPDFNSFDQTVPLLSKKYNTKLIKIALHDLGTRVKEQDAFLFTKEVLDFPIDTETIIWLEDISPIDDKTSYVQHVLEEAHKNEYLHPIFTGIEKHCEGSVINIPVIYWDTDYNEQTYGHIYVQPGKCHSEFYAPQPLHFRVYMNIIYEVTKELNRIPDTKIETVNQKGASLGSIIQCASLALQKGAPLRIVTNEKFAVHKLLTDAIIRGWSKPVPTIFGGDLNGQNSRISSLG